MKEITSNRKIELVNLTLSGIHATRAAEEIKILLDLSKDQMRNNQRAVSDEGKKTVFWKIGAAMAEDLMQQLADDVHFYELMADSTRELLQTLGRTEGFDVVKDVAQWLRDIESGKLSADELERIVKEGPDETKPVRVPVE